MFSVKGSISKRSWLVKNISLDSLLKQLNVKVDCMYIYVYIQSTSCFKSAKRQSVVLKILNQQIVIIICCSKFQAQWTTAWGGGGMAFD